MKCLSFLSQEEIAAYLSEEIISLLNKKPDASLGLATGSSPILTYKKLIMAYEEKRVSFAKAISYNLDEYIDCYIKEETYRYFMEENLFSHIDIKEENTHFPDENNPSRYDEELAKNPIDLQILGLGQNGHIGFNEPGTPENSLTHIVELDDITRKNNARFFNGDKNLVPKLAVTAGLKTIMNSKRIFLIVNGKNKAEAAEFLLNGKKDVATCPASILLEHPNAYMLISNDVVDSLSNQGKTYINIDPYSFKERLCP